jgi:hypothetical protein
MIRIIFTASIVKKGKGTYVAHAEGFPLLAETASTQRGAIKKLKAAVHLLLVEATAKGTRNDLLTEAGYSIWYTGFDDLALELEAHPYNRDKVSVPLPRQSSRSKRSKITRRP